MQGTKAAIKETGREMPHILVVDDEKSIGELLEITFRKEGHRVEVVHSVEAAKRKLESQIFDIIISDIRMPGQSGVDLLKFAKEIAPGSFFLLMTALPALDTAIAALNSGADRYVVKGDSLVDQLRLAVSPAQSFAPSNLNIRARVVPHVDNRALTIIAESADFYRSSQISLEGDHSPATINFEFREARESMRASS